MDAVVFLPYLVLSSFVSAHNSFDHFRFRRREIITSFGHLPSHTIIWLLMGIRLSYCRLSRIWRGQTKRKRKSMTFAMQIKWQLHTELTNSTIFGQKTKCDFPSVCLISIKSNSIQSTASHRHTLCAMCCDLVRIDTQAQNIYLYYRIAAGWHEHMNNVAAINNPIWC